MSRKRKKTNYQNFNYLMERNGVMYEEYQRLFYHFRNIALNLYKWENLPEGIESRYIEQRLFDNGQVFFTKDKTLGWLALSCNNSTNLNVYGEPTEVRVHGYGFSQNYNVEDGVRILNNDSALATIKHIDWYAKRMAHIESVMLQNLQQQRVPYFIGTSKETELSVKNMMDNVLTGESAIYMDTEKLKDISNNLVVFPTQAPYLLDKLQQERYELERELLTFLGINTTIEKKERLLVDETNANNGFIEMSLDLGLKQRQLACERINAKYNLNVRVVATMHEITPQISDENVPHGTNEEGEENVELHT